MIFEPWLRDILRSRQTYLNRALRVVWRNPKFNKLRAVAGAAGCGELKLGDFLDEHHFGQFSASSTSSDGIRDLVLRAQCGARISRGDAYALFSQPRMLTVNGPRSGKTIRVDAAVTLRRLRRRTSSVYSAESRFAAWRAMNRRDAEVCGWPPRDAI